MSIVDHPVWLFAGLFVALLITVEVGLWLRRGSAASSDEKLHDQIVGARDGLIVLLSLLLGFMLPMSLTRFDQRKHLAIEEALTA